jgi:signal transduction histidine kinase
MSVQLHAEPEGTPLEQLRELSDIGRALTYATSHEQVAQITVQMGAALLHAGSAVLMQLDADGLLQVRASHGIEDGTIARFRAPLTDEVIGRLQGLLEVPDECFIAVPLVVSGAVTGIIAVALPRPSSIPDEWILSALADLASVALENARLSGEVRVDMEERLRASESATSAKDRALSTLAHDIRSPLGAIEGYCAIMEGEMYGPINDKQREALGRIRMSGRHLLSLLDNVMDMARLNAGVGSVVMDPLQLGDVARDAVDIMMPGADARMQKLVLDSTAAPVVRGDDARLRQVLVNLIGNAVKFTPEGGEIRVSTMLIGAGYEQMGAIRIVDTGAGIAAAERASIFEPYYRSEATALAPGIGLGLAISYALVRQMGGDIDVDSELGVGSSFTVRLPLATREKREESHVRIIEASMDSFLQQYPEAVIRLARATRAYLHALLPDATETIDPTARIIGYGAGTGYKALICTIILSKTGIKIGIPESAFMEDPAGLLAGAGKRHKHVSVRSVEDLNNPALAVLLQESLSRTRRS